jgi:GGDEF domain-containing protein
MVLPPVIGALGIAVLVLIQTLAVAGRWRRSRWRKSIQEMEAAGIVPSQKFIERAERAERSSDFFSVQVRRAYYAVVFISSIILLFLPVFPLAAGMQILVRTALTALTFSGAVLLAYYWQGWDDDLDRLLRRRLRDAQERELERKGLPVRDAQTGVYTAEFWLHLLEGQIGWPIRRPLPISGLVVEVQGLDEFSRLYSATTVTHILGMIARGVEHSVRSSDIVCRTRSGRFAVALFRCSRESSEKVARRVVVNTTRLVLRGVNAGYRVELSLRWAAATLPGDATTPVQLLFAGEHLCEQAGTRMEAPGREPAEQLWA